MQSSTTQKGGKQHHPRGDGSSTPEQERKATPLSLKRMGTQHRPKDDCTFLYFTVLYFTTLLNLSSLNAHDGTGQPVEPNSSSAHIVKEQFAPEENRDIASFNADNEFNRAIDEENIDFNIPGVPHSAVKRSHGVNVRNLIQKIENHPQRHALQSDLQQHRQFNPFSKESQDVIKAAGNTELCELLDVELKAQCKVCLSYWNVGIVYCTCGHLLRDGTKENKKYLKFTLDLFSILHYYIRKGRPHGHRYGKKEGDHEYFIANQLKKMQEKRFLEH